LIYCDTSFLGALYLPEEVFEPIARTISANWDSSILFPWLTEIELCNAVYRGLGRKLYDKGTCAAILRQISADKTAGILSPRLLESELLLKGAIDLAKRFTAAHQCRTLDILHVVAALEFKADTMASFDNRQRQLAASTGLILLPERIPA
jgi:predicted nucleic acid-binding protein